MKAVNREGETVQVARRPYVVNHPQPGYAEQDSHTWYAAALSAMQAVVGENGSAVRGISIAGQMHGVVVVDSVGRALMPAVIWMDRRSTLQIAAIKQDNWLQLAHNPLMPGMLPATLMWLRDKKPGIYHRAASAYTPTQWLLWKFTHVTRTDPTDASGVLMLNIPERTISHDLLKAYNLRDDLFHTKLLEPDQRAGSLRPEFARKLNIAPDVPVAVGCADQAAALIGSGVVNNGQAALNIGTGGQFSVVTEDATPNADLNLFCGVRGMYKMGATLAAGYAMTWWTRITGEDVDTLVEEAVSIPAGCDGLRFRPMLNGTRNTPTALAGFDNLTAQHTRGHMTRAVMEGVALELRNKRDLLRDHGAGPQHIIFGGGGARELWGQIIADVLNQPLHTLSHNERTARGAAMLAAVVSGDFKSLDEVIEAWVKPGGHVFEPRDAQVRLYADMQMDSLREHEFPVTDTTRTIAITGESTTIHSVDLEAILDDPALQTDRIPLPPKPTADHGDDTTTDNPASK